MVHCGGAAVVAKKNCESEFHKELVWLFLILQDELSARLAQLRNS